ncbi:RILP-like protein homolog isoform X2 [Cimex lectularius]|uniref:RH2 domain-containing protein n=1 Tax=Cimex lectularius TaxID=79782 RepID=A0A8I6SL11_CIMLE|nr:RILP-like protein homolog isoform X2 [Cimex lectularius]
MLFACWQSLCLYHAEIGRGVNYPRGNSRYKFSSCSSLLKNLLDLPPQTKHCRLWAICASSFQPAEPIPFGELEQIEEHWREESHEMVQIINRLQEENRKLIKSLAEKQDSPSVNNSHPLSPELDIAVLQKSIASNEKLREQLKMKEREVNAKASEVDSLLDQVDRLSTINKELRKKIRTSQAQANRLIEERADILTQLQDQQYETSILRQRLGIAEKEKEDLAQSNVDIMEIKTKNVCDYEDPNRPRYTTEEIKEILKERNDYQAKISELERELEKYRKSDAINTEIEEDDDDDDDDDDDAPVQGPLPFEPNDAPWRKSESGIRKMFRKLFNETNMTFLGNSPKRSLSSLSKMTLTTTAGDTAL